MKRVLILYLLFTLTCLACLPKGIKGPTAKAPVFYPPPPAEPYLQFLTSFSSSRMTTALGSFAQFVLGGDRQYLGLNRPYGIASYQGKVYVCDSLGGAVFVFDFVKRSFSLLGMEGQGKLVTPINITISADGHKYITDTGRAQVVAFGPDDTFQSAYGQPGQAFLPGDVVVQGEKLLVTNMKESRVEIWDRASGKLISWFRPEKPEQKFPLPANMALDQQGNYYIVSPMLSNVQVFNSQGGYIRTIGEAGMGPGFFARPKGIAIDKDNRLYVVDAAFQNCQILNTDGKVYTWIGGPGDGIGEMDLPADITISYDPLLLDYFSSYAAPGFSLEYLVLVTNQLGPNKINVYGFGHKKG